MFGSLTLSALFALFTALAMIGLASYILFQHDANHEKFENWVDFSFTADSLTRALDYYRFMAISMLCVGIFSLFMLYDLKQILDGGETNYISATLALYLDIFNVFQSLLALLGFSMGERD